ncbi:hypothetical protein [Synechococcus sp. F70.1]|jgi:hypothetical protein|uniref:hypothetical protein n=1 Tax=Synechococcus sp. F70.1 TaxID=2964532 RepID=UPI0039C6AFD9
MHDLDSLPEPVANALIKSLLTDLERLINQHGLSEVLVGLAMYCNVQFKAKLNKPNRTEKDEELGFYFRDAAKALEVAASLTYRTIDRSRPSQPAQPNA